MQKPIEIFGRVVRGIQYVIYEYPLETHGPDRFYVFRKEDAGLIFYSAFRSMKKVDRHLFEE